MQCAIFCSIIDNFGDIGVCWRLARQLAAEYQLQVSLFVDDLPSFVVLAPQLNPSLPVQLLGQITVRHWTATTCFDHNYHIVIEGFGCRLSAQLIAQMQQQASTGQPPLWLNLEYMCAERWAMECHGMVSVHPATGLRQTFWFPSTSPHSGGLLREHDLHMLRKQFQHSHGVQEKFWQQLGLPDAMQFDRKISLFSYENLAIADLLDALAADTQTTLLLVPKSKSLPDIECWLQKNGIAQCLELGKPLYYQNLMIVVLPFLAHQQYDRLLWACDLNFVRGEDSCVRAHWAKRPFIWHIYPQEDNAHLTKLQAWIDQAGQHAQHIASWQIAMHCWNGAALSSPAIWQHALTDLPLWAESLDQWTGYLSNQPDLATRLMRWIQESGQGSV